MPQPTANRNVGAAVTFTVRDLLTLPEAGTRSLTPGVGEDRAISWAHVCELAEPWQWLGQGSLVMTTGLGIPESPDEQRAYFTSMHAAGIAAVTVGADMSAPPLAPSALAHAASIGFPVLETAYEIRFIGLATAVAEAAQRDRNRRIQQTERMYAVLSAHSIDERIDSLLGVLGEIIGATLTLSTHDRQHPGAHGRITQADPHTYFAPLHTLGEPDLVFTFARPGAAEYSVLQHAAGIVSSALSLEEASRRGDWMYGSILLNNLVDGTVPAELAKRLIAAHRLSPPFLLVTCDARASRSAFDAAQALFSSEHIPAVATIKDAHLLLLTGADGPVDRALVGLSGASGGVGVSAAFSELEGLAGAARQAQIALSRTTQSGEAEVVRFDTGAAPSLFLPSEASQLRALAEQVLGALQAYDQHRGTPLVHTLQVFLEENRSWVRAAERLFIHRQTLVARIARIESITGRDLNSMEDAAECWLAVRAAVECGELPAS